MKICIIGSTQYRDRILEWKKRLEKDNHEVSIPAFDDMMFTALEVCEYNRAIIFEADEVHMFWDQRSPGVLFDFGMVFAFKKRFKIIYMNQITFKDLMEKYAAAMDK